MLNISKNTIEPLFNPTSYSSYRILNEKNHRPVLIYILIGAGFFAMILAFLPWTQNIQAKGKVTTLNPFDRPQSVMSMIDGRIEKWFVKEGDRVSEGDTLVVLSEAKEEYFDPNIIANTQNEMQAKNVSISSYKGKMSALDSQYQNIDRSRLNKIEQIEFKRQQLQAELEALKTALTAADIYKNNMQTQLDRTLDLYNQGIKSLTELENKRADYTAAQAKLTEITNKIQNQNTELQNIDTQLELTQNEYREKLNKIQSERMETMSSQMTSQAEMNKLQSKIGQLTTRQENYVIVAPISGTLQSVKYNGIGEVVKSGSELLTIVPLQFQVGVEAYINPVDMPLISKGQSIRLQFDGWPAVVFRGWPAMSYGTFDGTISVIDRNISPSGKYRVLISPNTQSKSWPPELMLGTGARILILLKDVPVYYEIWRKLNGFPPDFYSTPSDEDIKMKAPIKRLK